MVGVGRPDVELPCRFRPDAVVAHQLGNGVDTTGVAPSDQLLVDAGAAVAGLDLGVDGPDLHQESVVALLLGAWGPLPPGVVAGGADTQCLAEQADRPAVLVPVDEAVGHVASRAKNAAAFFRMSRSASSRLFWARRRRPSSSRGERWPWPGKACSPLSSRAGCQLRSRFSERPRERAAAATE